MTSELPPGWAETKLENLVEILDRKRVPVNAKERAERLAAAETTYPYYGATGQVGEIDDFIFEGESVLLGEDGVPFFDPYKHKAYLVSGQYWVNNHAHVLRGNGAVNNRFLTHQLNVVDYRQYVSGTTRLKLTQASMKDLPIRVPPIGEQERIAETIEILFAELDKGEESLRQVQTLLARYRQSILKAAVTGELTADWRAERAGKFEHGRDLLERILQTRRETWQGRGRYAEPGAPNTQDLAELPDGWVWASIDALAVEMQIGLVRSVAQQTLGGDGTKYLKMDRVNMAGELDLDTDVKVSASDAEVDRFSLRQGDILFNTRNSLELVGKNGIVAVEPSEPVIFNNNLMRIRFVRELNPEFANYSMCSPVFRKELQRVKRATTSVAAVYAGDLKTLPIAVPPVDEQVEISIRVSEELAKVRAVNEWCVSEVTRCGALRQSILKDAFSGRLVPQDPTDEPASDLLARIRQSRDAGKRTTPQRTTRTAGEEAWKLAPGNAVTVVVSEVKP